MGICWIIESKSIEYVIIWLIGTDDTKKSFWLPEVAVVPLDLMWFWLLNIDHQVYIGWSEMTSIAAIGGISKKLNERYFCLAS